jgi:hypothetical protein
MNSYSCAVHMKFPHNGHPAQHSTAQHNTTATGQT